MPNRFNEAFDATIRGLVRNLGYLAIEGVEELADNLADQLVIAVEGADLAPALFPANVHVIVDPTNQGEIGALQAANFPFFDGNVTAVTIADLDALFQNAVEEEDIDTAVTALVNSLFSDEHMVHQVVRHRRILSKLASNLSAARSDIQARILLALVYVSIMSNGYYEDERGQQTNFGILLVEEVGNQLIAFILNMTVNMNVIKRHGLGQALWVLANMCSCANVAEVYANDVSRILELFGPTIINNIPKEFNASYDMIVTKVVHLLSVALATEHSCSDPVIRERLLRFSDCVRIVFMNGKLSLEQGLDAVWSFCRLTNNDQCAQDLCDSRLVDSILLLLTSPVSVFAVSRLIENMSLSPSCALVSSDLHYSVLRIWENSTFLPKFLLRKGIPVIEAVLSTGSYQVVLNIMRHTELHTRSQIVRLLENVGRAATLEREGGQNQRGASISLMQALRMFLNSAAGIQWMSDPVKFLEVRETIIRCLEYSLQNFDYLTGLLALSLIHRVCICVPDLMKQSFNKDGESFTRIYALLLAGYNDLTDEANPEVHNQLHQMANAHANEFLNQMGNMNDAAADTMQSFEEQLCSTCFRKG
ncbi:hypothetical protein BDR26DRAFT_900156 [Obelidium mucronatum]|nr:hypothetical protein BDR26DRAFT_900156 [Obelidium mucronatum]